MPTLNAKERRAFDDGAHAARGGLTEDRVHQFWRKDEVAEKAAWVQGFRLQKNLFQRVIRSADFQFLLTHEKPTEGMANEPATEERTMRTTEQIEAIKAEYRTSIYDPYAAEQTAAGHEPQDFDEAFNNHLAALDAAAAEGTGSGDTVTGAAATTAPTRAEQAAARKAERDAAKAEAKAKKDAMKAEAKAKKEAEKAAAEAAKAAQPAARKAKKYRPTSADRAKITAAGKSIVGADATPRLKLSSGAPYVDFLKGMDTDADGNLTVSLGVYTAKDTATKVGDLTVTVAKGEFVSVQQA